MRPPWPSDRSPRRRRDCHASGCGCAVDAIRIACARCDAAWLETACRPRVSHEARASMLVPTSMTSSRALPAPPPGVPPPTQSELQSQTTTHGLPCPLPTRRHSPPAPPLHPQLCIHAVASGAVRVRIRLPPAPHEDWRVGAYVASAAEPRVVLYPNFLSPPRLTTCLTFPSGRPRRPRRPP